MAGLYEELDKDVRYIEEMKACFNCGICTAICPAAEVSDYDPRMVMNIVQQRDEAELEKLLKSDTIWRCGECLSCKTRCPRGNTPCYVIQALRALSIESGFFAESAQGRKQLAIKRTVGDHILKYGYFVYIDEVDNDLYPERRHCCGFGFRQYLLKSNRSYSVSNSKKKFDSMLPFKPDLIIANCPGCTFFLDRWQYVIAEIEGKTYGENSYGIPVLTYEELAGLLLGYDPWDIGLQTHQVAVEPLLQKLGIEYNPEQKYKGPDGRELGRPELPEVLKCV